MVPKSIIRRIMENETKKHNMRISKDAIEKMCEEIEDIGVDISKQAKKLAKSAGIEWPSKAEGDEGGEDINEPEEQAVQS